MSAKAKRTAFSRRPLRRLRPHDGRDQDGKGRAPKPFMLAKAKPKRTQPGIQSRLRGEARAKTKVRRRSQGKEGFGDAGLRAAAALRLGGASTERGRVVPRIKFDGYRVQLRVEDGEVALNTRKGWTGRTSFQRLQRKERPPDVDRWRDRRRGPQRPAGLFCVAGGDRRRQDRNLVYSRSICCSPMARPACAAFARAQGAAEGICWRRARAKPS